MNKEQLKEHIVNDIKELKQHIIAIEKSLQKFRISFLHYKKNIYDEKTSESFFQDFPNFIWLHNTEPHQIVRPEILESNINTMATAINYSWEFRNPSIERIVHLYLKVEDILINTMLFKEKKLKCYENIIKHYPEKTNIKNIMEFYPEKPEKIEIKNKQYSISLYVIFLIMIVFYIITVTTVILLINHNNSTIQLDHPIQCIMPTFKNTQFIDKHDKLKDLKKILIIN